MKKRLIFWIASVGATAASIYGSNIYLTRIYNPLEWSDVMKVFAAIAMTIGAALTTWFVKGLYREPKASRFNSWQEAAGYLNCVVRVHQVEKPDIIGRMEGIELRTVHGNVVSAYLKVNGLLWDFHRCSTVKNQL